jgi:hypothetical protein
MFKKGESGNRKGRPQGTPNKVNHEIRERINDFLDNNFELIQNDLLELESKERVKFYIDLLQFGLPKLKQVELTNDPDAISHEDLDLILTMLADAK